MKKTRQKYEGIFFSKGSDTDFNTVNDAIPTLIKKGIYKDLWQSPQFKEANQLSQHLVKSATLLKKHLPKHFQENIRFTQSPNTWILSVNDNNLSKQLSAILNDNYQILQNDSELPQFLKLRRAYRYWEKAGERLSDLKDLSKKNYINKLCHLIPNNLHTNIRLQYQPSIWQLNVANANIATRLNLLLDNLSLLLAKDMGFAPKLKLIVVPNHWETSGFMLTELVKERKKIPTEAEADEFLAAFIKTNI